MDCHYPGCNQAAARSWALVPLCEEHQEAIKAETVKYYSRRITYHGRQYYMGIMPMVPWSRKE